MSEEEQRARLLHKLRFDPILEELLAATELIRREVRTHPTIGIKEGPGGYYCNTASWVIYTYEHRHLNVSPAMWVVKLREILHIKSEEESAIKKFFQKPTSHRSERDLPPTPEWPVMMSPGPIYRPFPSDPTDAANNARRFVFKKPVKSTIPEAEYLMEKYIASLEDKIDELVYRPPDQYLEARDHFESLVEKTGQHVLEID